MQPQTDEQRGKRARALMEQCKVPQIAESTGLQPWFHGVRATELIPPMQSVPRRRGLLGVVEGTRQREVPRESKVAA